MYRTSARRKGIALLLITILLLSSINAVFADREQPVVTEEPSGNIEEQTAVTDQVIQPDLTVTEQVYGLVGYTINVEAIDTEGNTIKTYEIIKDEAGIYEIQPNQIEGYECLSEVEEVELTEDSSIKIIVFEYKRIEIPVITEYRDRVYDTKTGKGIEGVEITATSKTSNEEFNSFTDNEGYFQFELLKGDYILKLVIEGYRERTIDIRVE